MNASNKLNGGAVRAFSLDLNPGAWQAQKYRKHLKSDYDVSSCANQVSGNKKQMTSDMHGSTNIFLSVYKRGCM